MMKFLFNMKTSYFITSYFSGTYATSIMVILKSDTQGFNHDFIQTFFRDKESDCSFYSADGMKFQINKEMFCSSDFMRNVLIEAENTCCKEIEILCPCSSDELEARAMLKANPPLESDDTVPATKPKSDLSE